MFLSLALYIRMLLHCAGFDVSFCVLSLTPPPSFSYSFVLLRKQTTSHTTLPPRLSACICISLCVSVSWLQWQAPLLCIVPHPHDSTCSPELQQPAGLTLLPHTSILLKAQKALCCLITFLFAPDMYIWHSALVVTSSVANQH